MNFSGKGTVWPLDLHQGRNTNPQLLQRSGVRSQSCVQSQLKHPPHPSTPPKRCLFAHLCYRHTQQSKAQKAHYTKHTHSVNDSVNGERRGEVSNTHSRPHNLHGNGEDDGGTSLCRDGVQSLQVSQLEGGRRSYRVSRFLQSTRRIQFTLGRNYLERNIKVELRLF